MNNFENNNLTSDKELYEKTIMRLNNMGMYDKNDMILYLAKACKRYEEKIFDLEGKIASKELEHKKETRLLFDVFPLEFKSKIKSLWIYNDGSLDFEFYKEHKESKNPKIIFKGRRNKK